MARPRLINIDATELLQGIANAQDIQTKTLIAEIEAGKKRRDASHYAIQLELDDLLAEGFPYHIPSFLGRFPSGSERVKCQSLIRELEAAGLVTIFGQKATRILMTEIGWAKLAKAKK